MASLISNNGRRLVQYFGRGVCALVTATILTLACKQVDIAYAGTYVMRSCNVPGERPAPASPWTWVHAVNTSASDECGNGGGFGLNAGPMQRTAAAALVLERPREGPQSVITIRRVRLWMVARLSGSGSALFVATASGGSTGAISDNLFGPPGGDTLMSPYISPILLADTASYVVVLSCSGSSPDGCNPASVTPLEIRGAEATLQEDVSPTGSIGGGSLLDGSAQVGLRSVNYAVIDQESGVAQVSAALGSTVVATQDFSSECTHSDFAACPRNRHASLMVDTRKVPDGTYPLSLRVTDAAGNREAIQPPDVIRVANGSADQALTPNGDGATGDARLKTTFVGKRGSTLTVPYNRGVTIRGSLTTSSGRPIRRASVEVAETPVHLRERSKKRTAVTDANGRFRVRLGRHAMSRTLRFQYRPNLGDQSVAATDRLRLNVAASGTLRVALQGVRVTYGGRVLTRPIPARGKRIHVEGRAMGGAWITFAVRRTDRFGQFSGRYRLRVRRPGVRLQFRIRIPNEKGYPYVASAGRAVTRTVR